MSATTENAARSAVRDRIAALNAEAEALLEAAALSVPVLGALLESRDYEAAYEESLALLKEVARLRRLAREAAGLCRALGEGEGKET